MNQMRYTKIFAGILILAVVLVGIGPAGAQVKPKLTVWIMTTFVAAQNDFLKTKTEEWAKAAGVEVVISMMPRVKYGVDIVTAIEARMPPNVVLQGEPGVGIAAEIGMLIPLDDVVNKLGREDFYPAILEQNLMPDPITKTPRIWGIPLFFEPYVFQLRTDILEKSGWPAKAKKPFPTTWDELFDAARAMNKLPDPITKKPVYGLGITLGRCYDNHNNHLALIYSYGGGLISDRSPKCADVFNTAPTWKAFDDLKKLYEEGVIPLDSVGWTDFDNNLAYMEGRTALILNPMSVLYSMIDAKSPYVPVTKLVPIGPAVINGGGESAFCFKSTPQKEALSKDLIHHILKDKEAYRVNMVELARTYGLPIFKSQGNIITKQWKEGKWPWWAVDPMAVALASYNQSPTAYPLREALSVVDKIFGAYLIPDENIILYTRGTDSKKVAEAISKKINKMCADTYK